MSLSPTATLVDVAPVDLKQSYVADEASFFPRDSMSLSVSNDFPFLLDNTITKSAPFAFPSPPPSVHASDNGLDFDLDTFAHCSPASDVAFGLVSTPASSINVVSPKTVSVSEVPAPLPASAFSSLTGSGSDPKVYSDNYGSSESLAAEALSSHHLQRYFHYKALAAQAEAAAAAAQHAFGQMYPPIGPTSQSVYGMSVPAQHQFHPAPFVVPSAAAQQQQAAAAAMHAQANAHMQAHDVALAQAQQQRTMPMSYYMPTAQRTSFESMAASQPMWSRQSISSSIASPPYPSTPNYSQAVLPQIMSKTTTSTSLPSIPSAPMDPATRPLSEGEAELEDELDGSDDEESTSSPSMTIANPHGGGRGYVPGKTPDDPKKRHKCTVCGRGFARAFNLKVRSLFIDC